jgi:hypothetical protein
MGKTSHVGYEVTQDARTVLPNGVLMDAKGDALLAIHASFSDLLN